MCAHQLILGETVDFITGETLVDTIDERARQKIARFLVDEKGYSKSDIVVRQEITRTIYCLLSLTGGGDHGYPVHYFY